MARLKNGISGSGTGKIGNVIMYEIYGKSYIRSRPETYRDKKSPSQLAQRQRMKLGHNILLHLNRLLRITMRQAAIGKSPYHTALSLNLKGAIDGEYPNQYIDPSKVVLSSGNLPLPEKATAKKTEKGILLKWSVNKNEMTLPNQQDTLIWCMKDLETLSYANFETTNIKRLQGKYILPFPHTDKPLNIWVMFRNQDETDISNTMWTGQV